MPLDKYKTFYDIVGYLYKMDLTKLRSVKNELQQLSKVFPKSPKFKKRKGTKKGMRRKTARPAYEGLKRKKTVGKIYKTKNGQPYKILASGKAKFLKKR